MSIQCVLWLVVLTVGSIKTWDIAVSHEEQLDFYTNETKIDTVRIQSHNLAALTYDEVHNMLLYADKQSGNDAICGYNISSKTNKCFTERNIRNIHGLSFDPATQVLFFTDTTERSINWITLKPGSLNNIFGNLLLKMEHGIPTDIAVDSCRGYVYWINTNLTTPTIERARFNGSEREVLISTKSYSLNTSYQLEPHSLTIDQQTRRLYWMEPRNESTYHVHYTDLNGKNETHYCRIYGGRYYNPSSNIMTISKTSLYLVFWSDINIRANIFGKNKYIPKEKKTFDLHIRNAVVGITANYKIKERIQGIDNCEPLMSLERNNSDENKSDESKTGENKSDVSKTGENKSDVSKTGENKSDESETGENKSDASFCAHGVKVIGQSLCKCSPGYIGDHCDVSVCYNFCLEGNCSVNSYGSPECRCDAGYSGHRCEVDLCRGFCLNSGECYLNEENEPLCQCFGSYEGARCETAQNDNFASTSIPYLNKETFETAENVNSESTGIPMFSTGTKLNLVDLLASFRKPKILLIVDGA